MHKRGSAPLFYLQHKSIIFLEKYLYLNDVNGRVYFVSVITWLVATGVPVSN